MTIKRALRKMPLPAAPAACSAMRGGMTRTAGSSVTPARRSALLVVLALTVSLLAVIALTVALAASPPPPTPCCAAWSTTAG